MNVYAINICTNSTDDDNKFAVNQYPIIVVGTEEELLKKLNSKTMNSYIVNTLKSENLYKNSVYRIKVVEDDYWMREFEWKISHINKIDFKEI